MRREKIPVPSRHFAANAKTAVAGVLALLLVLGQLAVVKADWESDANARIEANRKRNAEILVVDLGGHPIENVSVKSDQIKHRFGFGTCLTSGQVTNTNHQNFIRDHFEWAVCENDMKWSSNEYTRDVWTFSNADTIANWCANNDIILRGHTLVWETNSQTPPWVAGLPCATYPTTSEMLEEVDERISYTVDRYAGQIVQWDINNEMLSGNMFDCLGEAGRAHMFNLANSVDPDCVMMMNEYSGNSFGGYDGDAYRNRAAGLIALGAAVEGLGIQAHVGSPFRPEDYYNLVLNELDDLGLPIMATEFDTDASTDAQAADDLENLYRICFSHPLVEGIIMWGYDQNAWRGNGIVNSSTWVLNAAGVRYEALLDEWTTNDSNTTNPSGIVTFRGFHGTYDINLIASGYPAEVKTIEVEPGAGTQTFILQMNIPGEPDYNAPTPDPMTWATDPHATSPYSISMTATTATDNSGVEYYFDCLTTGGHDSDWQDSTTYEDTGLNPSTSYSYQVKARDKSPYQNETGLSGSRSATTWPPDTTPPTPNPMDWFTVPTATGPSTITMTANTATDANTPPVQYYFECTSDGDFNSAWQSSSTYVASGLTPNTSYSFKARARDSAPALNTTGWSTTLWATTEPPPTDIEILGSWATGTSHAKEDGYNRALIFIAHVEEAGAISLNSVTYGGQTMTKVIDMTVGTNPTAYVAAYILNETGVAAATSGTFTPTWSTTPDVVAYSSVFLSNVDQTALTGASASNSIIGTGSSTITTSSLPTSDGDMVIDAATCGNTGTYTVNSGFTKAIEHSMSSSDGVVGYKFATGVNETPSVTHSNLNRQVIIGFVVQAGVPVDLPPAAPTGLVGTAGNESASLDWNDNGEADMNGYNVYRSTTQGSNYARLNSSLLSNSDYTDNGLTNGITYYYVVKAVDDANQESGYSNEAPVEPTYQTCADVQTGNDRLLSDLTGDCYVDYYDLDIVANYWLYTDCGSYGDCEKADFPLTDGTVDFFDFSDFAQQWMECNNPEDMGNCTPNW